MLSVRPQPWSVESMLRNSLGILVLSGVALAHGFSGLLCACVTSTVQLIVKCVDHVSEGLGLELDPHSIPNSEFLRLSPKVLFINEVQGASSNMVLL